MKNSITLKVLLICAAIASESFSQEIPSNPESLHVYLLIGQSNMAGRAPLEAGDTDVVPQCFLLNGSDLWEPAQNPLNAYSTIRKDISMQKLNPGYTFSQSMIDTNSTVSIGLVVNARGGTSITEWEKGDSYYEEAIRRTQIAQTNGTLKGILWHQGESDYTDAQYFEKLTNLVENLRNDLGDQSLPFIAGEIKSEGTLINSQINQLPSSVPFTGVASSAGLMLLDTWHFDNSSQKLLGERYAEEMQRVQLKQSLIQNLNFSAYVDGDSYKLIFQTMTNGQYGVQYTDSLTRPNWNSLIRFDGINGYVNLYDSMDSMNRFYRVNVGLIDE